MQSYFVLFLVALVGALVVSTIATPIVRAAAVRWGAIDKPAARKVHTAPIPLWGGLAIWMALWTAALFAVRSTPADHQLVPASTLPELGAIFAGATLVLFVGIVDDRRGEMAPFTKIVFQIIACMILLAFGLHVNAFGIAWLDYLMTFFWVIGLTNALNLLDNMDGLSAGAASIAAAFFCLLAVLNGQILVALLAAALVGSCLGFLVYNYNPASIFMGDTGSLTLGFMLAVLGMKLQIHNLPHLSFVIAALVVGVPIFDTAFVVWRRVTEGRRITQGGKDHTSHRLVNLGLTHRQAVWILYGACFVLGLLALVGSQGGGSTVGVILPFAAAVVAAALLLARVDTAVGPTATAAAGATAAQS